MIINCTTLANTQQLAKKLAQFVPQNFIIYLSGNLGAGKTTFAQGFIGYFGFKKVKSPTYSIVESYTQVDTKIHHFDLYRLKDSEELEMLGVREYFDDICLIEWAENVENYLPRADLIIEISGNTDRNIKLIANTKRAKDILLCLK